MIGAMKLRIARHTDRLDEVVRFYRDRVGLPEIGSFQDHDGYDGVFLAIPGSGTHLELTTGGAHRAPAPHPESLLVLYLESQREIDAIAERIAQPAVMPANPYWQRNSQAYADPDGFQVLLTLSEQSR
jgi:catechol 2,3-dioxygenase-like lactoylglutathione lyase family enzyme